MTKTYTPVELLDWAQDLGSAWAIEVALWAQGRAGALTVDGWEDWHRCEEEDEG